MTQAYQADKELYFKAQAIVRGLQAEKNEAMSKSYVDQMMRGTILSDLDARMKDSNHLAQIRTRIIHRVNWWQMLTKGAGAKATALMLNSQNIPIQKKWVVRNRNPDRVCRSNAMQGWIKNDKDFRSGHGMPPAHPGCGCELRLSTGATQRQASKMFKKVMFPTMIDIPGRK